MKHKLSRKLRYLIRQDSAAGRLLFHIYKPLKKGMRNYKILPLEWMDQAPASESGLLCKGKILISHGPRYLNGRSIQAQVHAPDLYYRAFKHARICSTSSSIILDDQKCLIERFSNISQDKFELSGGQVIMHGQKTAIVRFGTTEQLEKGIFICGNGSYNYYHWLIEIIPKLEFLDKLPERTKTYPLLVNEAVAKTPTFKEILEKFAPNREIIYLSNTTSYLVHELINIDTPNNMPFNLSNGMRFDTSYSITRQEAIDYLRRVTLKPSALPQPGDIYPKRIFLCRKKSIRNYNQQEVEACLTKFGFQSIFMEEVSFEQQVAIINHAEYIVGPTGAAWTNLIFCRAGTKCLCWMAEEYGDFSAFSNLAAIVGADLRYITYKTGANSTHQLHKMNYIIDVNQIEHQLSDLMSS